MKIVSRMVLIFLLAGTQGFSQSRPVPLVNGFWRLQIRDGAVTDLQADPTGRGRRSLHFLKDLRPDGWRSTPQTRVNKTGNETALGPFGVWQDRAIVIRQGAEGAVADLLLPAHTLAQTFQIPSGTSFTTVSVLLPTWHTSTSGATLTLYRSGIRVASRQLRNVPDNSWQTISNGGILGPGSYTIELSNPEGMIGWWSSQKDVFSGGQALQDGTPLNRDRTLQVDSADQVGTGSLRLALHGNILHSEASIRGSGPMPARLGLQWRTTWTKEGYDCTPAAGVVFRRFLTDNQRYMPVEQLKRRPDAGLSFDGCGWIRMDGTRDAALRLEGDDLHLNWEMQPREMALQLTMPLVRSVGGASASWDLRVLPPAEPVPEEFPRFLCSSRSLTGELNRFWWERGFTYPAPAGNAGWFEWMSLIRGWYAGPQRTGEMNHLLRYPLQPDGYVNTWDGTVGWPFPASPPYDTRHFDTNARFILACWRYYLWTGDRKFLQSQAERLRQAMRYQLETLHGAEGLIVTASKDVTGLHRAIGDNYWDILPFGNLDAYANAVFYGSLEAMAGVQTALGEAPLTDYAKLRRQVHHQYDALFWDERAGRYIGCVDVDGMAHDYGFTFVNIEALYYGLGDISKARRIYQWMETEPTSTGKPDTYSQWIFAPRANTIHNPEWDDHGPKENSGVPPWWSLAWHGTPYGEQCQDGGAILYLSYFDLMVRLRYFGVENAWKRFTGIMDRYRLPDRLCGGPPLYRGETPQQESPGSVGLDLPFPESGLVPCFFLYGILGVQVTPEGLHVDPHLPRGLSSAGVQWLDWNGTMLAIDVRGGKVRVMERTSGHPSESHDYLIPRGGGGILIPAVNTTPQDARP